jgi:glycosyltransferase involved in cell wall biosynthesis
VRIGINLIPLRPGRMGGAEVYFRDLLAELLRRADHEYVLITADYNHASLPPDTPRCRRIPFVHEGRPARPGMRRLAAALPSLARLRSWVRRVRPASPAPTLRDVIRRERLDLWFCPFTDLEPRVAPVPSVITLYDLQHEFYPEFFAPEELAHRRAFYPESCAAAGHIIAISEFTRRSAIERYGVEPERISSVWLGAAADVDWAGGAARAAEVRATYGLPDRYAFYPANTWHHKNHLRLIEAIARHRRRHDDGLGLVLTGIGENGQRRLEAAVTEHGLDGAVHALGFVPRTDLPALYAGAACLVLPSLFEGFGIPLVEAMLAGCPIAAARATSIPEVTGDAAVLFDPLDPADICRALESVTRDPALAAELTRRGRARAPLFSVAAMTERTLEVFERARRGTPAVRSGAHVAIAVDGVYGDRWMGREGALALRGSLVSVEVHGELPRCAPLLPQELVVRVAGREPQVVVLRAHGPFSFTVGLGGARPDPEFWEISLSPRRTFRPDRHGPSTDSRELSVQLSLVRAVTADGRHVVRTLGAA